MPYQCKKNQKLLHDAAFYICCMLEKMSTQIQARYSQALCITSDSTHHCQPQVTRNHDSDPILVQLSHFKKSPNLPLERGQPPFETGRWLLWAVMRIKLLFLKKSWYSHIFSYESRTWNFTKIQNVIVLRHINMRDSMFVQVPPTADSQILSPSPDLEKHWP